MQFRLSTLFLLCIVAAIGAVAFRQHIRIASLEAEAAKLRSQNKWLTAYRESIELTRLQPAEDLDRRRRAIMQAATMDSVLSEK